MIFGYGSLINKDSLKVTVPDAEEIRPCFIKGFIRSFSLWDPIGFNETNLDVKEIPFCALDIEKIDDNSKIVNGIVFNMNETNFNKLIKREQEYKLIKTDVYDWYTKEILGSAFLFFSNKNNGKYNFGCKAQERYLDVCLKGAKAFGDDFYKTFLKTTFLDGKKLEKWECGESNLKDTKVSF